MMQKYICGVVASVLFSLAGFSIHTVVAGEQISAVFAEGNKLYRDGDFAGAAAAYERIRVAGYESGNLYYNLGNSYFRSGDTGRAVLNYERARFLNPGDSDIISNYAFVRSQEGLPVPQLGGMRIIRINDRLWERMGLNVLTVVVSALFIMIFACLTAGLFIRHDPARTILRWVCTACCIAMCTGGWALVRRTLYLKRAAVAVKEASVLFAPIESATAYFQLAPGRLVEVLEESGAYAKVRRSDGKLGWIKKDTIERVINRSR